MKEFDVHTFPNGIRLVHKTVPGTKVFHCGFVLDIGSRDEAPHQQGIAHFWEHMAFKGTHRRKAFHILNRLESLGGELNAYTTKEKIFFYASVLDQFHERAIDLLTDITFDSVFPEKQIEKERTVILEEMAMYHDTPEDALQDEFDDVIFSNHPLGKNMLGTEESIRSFRRNDFQEFIAGNISTDRVILTTVGNIPFRRVLRTVEKYVKELPERIQPRNRMTFTGYTPSNRTVNRNLVQAHCAIGRDAYPVTSENRLPFFMLVNLLGGPGMNSRLNMELREKYGFVYSIDASYSPYSDTGLFGVYFGTDAGQLERCVGLVKREFRKLRNKSLGTMQLHRAKEQLMGQLAMAEENNLNLMLMMGRSILDLGTIESLDEIFSRIRGISSSRLQDISRQMLEEDLLSQLRFLPKN